MNIYEIKVIHSGKEMSFDLKIPDNENLLEHIFNSESLGPDVKMKDILSIKLVNKCFGCRWQKPDQKSHMSQNGCLE